MRTCSRFSKAQRKRRPNDSTLVAVATASFVVSMSPASRHAGAEAARSWELGLAQVLSTFTRADANSRTCRRRKQKAGTPDEKQMDSGGGTGVGHDPGVMLRFDRLVMPDGRRAPIHVEIVELYHAPSGEKVDVEGAIESGGWGRKSVEHTVIGAGAGALLGGIFGGGKGAGIGSTIGGAGGLGTTAFRGRQKITLSSGQEMLIRITSRRS